MRPCHRTGCNSPQGECSGACMTHSIFSTKARCEVHTNLHRVHTTDLPDDRAAVVMGRPEELPVQFAEEEPPEQSRFTFSLNTWRLYRRSGCGVRQSLRKAFAAWRGQF